MRQVDSLYPIIDTPLDSDELAAQLKTWEPWGHRIDFTNGFSTKELKRRTPFSENTLQKFKIVEKHIPFDSFKGGNLLDIGCNSGYNSMYASSAYEMKTTGIDVNPRHIKVSRFLTDLSDLDCDFQIGSAETYSNKFHFDVILHFGTLYHLPNPLLSLQTSYNNLKEGGYLAIETQVYDDPKDPNLIYFMHMHNNDNTNFWALSTDVLKRYLEFIGFTDFKELLRVKPKLLENNKMSRVICAVKK